MERLLHLIALSYCCELCQGRGWVRPTGEKVGPNEPLRICSCRRAVRRQLDVTDFAV